MVVLTKRILMVASEFPPYGSGIANVVFALKNSLLKEGLNISVLSSHGADVNIGHFSNSYGLLGLIPFWQHALKYITDNEDQYDLIWLHSPIFIKTKLRCRTKLMFSVHTTYFGFYQAYKKEHYNMLLPYYRFASTLEHQMFNSISNCENVIVTAVSPSVADEAKMNGLSLSPIIIPNGIKFGNTSIDKENARKFINKRYKLSFSTNDLVLLYMGRLTEQKRPCALLNYFKDLNEIDPHLNLIICGRGNMYSKLSQIIKNERNATLLGYVSSEDLSLLVRASDAFISLSCYEGLPLTVLEAAAQDLPLLLSSIPPHEELIRSGISEGILVRKDSPKPEDVVAWIRKSKSSNKTAKIQQQFSWDSIAKQYIELLED